MNDDRAIASRSPSTPTNDADDPHRQELLGRLHEDREELVRAAGAVRRKLSVAQDSLAFVRQGMRWLLVVGGFMPIPMKVFTWASGIVGVPMPQYVLSMLVGRGKRVYLLALAIRIGGPRAEATLRRYIEPIGWAASLLLVVALGWLIWHARQGA